MVTGAATGIGQAIALRLAGDGAAVAVLDRQEASETVDRITAAGGRASAHRLDVTDDDAVRAVVDDVTAALGPADILVNNAGIYPHIPFPDLTMDDWRRTFAVNVEGTFSTMAAFTPGMRERGWGRVINISSNSVGLVIANLTHYVASKMAVIGLTRGAATELADAGITVNSVGPSLVRTPQSITPEGLYDVVPQLQAIKRPQTPQDVAGVVAFLAGPDAGFITGQNIWIDGGLARS